MGKYGIHETHTQHLRRTRSSGFTLVEILVVLIIVALTTLITVENLTNFKRRNELEAGATALSRFLDSAPQWAKDQHTSVFLIWDPGQGSVEIALDSAGTSVLDHHDLPKCLVVSPSTQVVYRCDTFGRAFLSTGSVMLQTPQSVLVNHVSMVSGHTLPHIEYSLTISPLWNVALGKRILG